MQDAWAANDGATVQAALQGYVEKAIVRKATQKANEEAEKKAKEENSAKKRKMIEVLIERMDKQRVEAMHKQRGWEADRQWALDANLRRIGRVHAEAVERGKWLRDVAEYLDKSERWLGAVVAEADRRKRVAGAVLRGLQ